MDSDRVKRIFFPYMDEKTQSVLASGGRFVYYTTAETATSILRHRQMWMRSTTTMNDYMEVEHGLECLDATYNAEPGQVFDRAINTCFAGLAEELRNYFEAWRLTIRVDTYMTCVSEHSAEEDEHGRLSMWRAYGGQAGVALVLNGAVMFRETDALGAYSSPVAYLNPDAFAAAFARIAQNIEESVEYVRSLDRETVRNILFNVLRFAVLCTKHPAFHEEREWRVVASPRIFPSELLKATIEVVRGTPQTVLKIDLQDHPDQNLVGLALPRLLNRIIIGPCEFPGVILTAFHQLLVEAGVDDPNQKIVVSGIPLRQL